MLRESHTVSRSELSGCSFDDFTVSSLLTKVFCKMALLHPCSPLCLLPVGSAVLMSDCSCSSFGLGENRVLGGGYVECMCTHVPAHTTHSLWASTLWKQLFILVKTNPQWSSEVIAVRQGKGQFKPVTRSELGIPPGKGHLERRYESNSTLEPAQKAKQLIYYAVTL